MGDATSNDYSITSSIAFGLAKLNPLKEDGHCFFCAGNKDWHEDFCLWWKACDWRNSHESD